MIGERVVEGAASEVALRRPLAGFLTAVCAVHRHCSPQVEDLHHQPRCAGVDFYLGRWTGSSFSPPGPPKFPLIFMSIMSATSMKTKENARVPQCGCINNPTMHSLL
jgi:hypothetical protein